MGRLFMSLPEQASGGGAGGPSSVPKMSKKLGHISQPAPPVASHQRLLGGMAGQISLMSEAPVLIGALCSVVPSQAFIFNAGKGWIFFLSHSHAFSPWLMAPHSERPLHQLIGFNYWGN